MKITLNKISQEVIQSNEVLEPEVQYKDDPNQVRGYQKVVSEGKPGQKQVSYVVNQKNPLHPLQNNRGNSHHRYYPDNLPMP